MQNKYLKNIGAFLLWWVTILFVLSPLAGLITLGSEFDLNNYYDSFFEFDQRTFILSFICSLPFFIYKYVVVLISVMQQRISLEECINKAGKYIAILIIYFALFFMFDINILRGLILFEDWYRSDRESTQSNVDMAYQLKKEKDGWHFSLKNESINYYVYVNYRNEQAFPEPFYNDSLFFSIMPMKTKVDSLQIGPYYGFACGTGLGAILILPYEEFSYKFKNVQNLINLHVSDYFVLDKSNSNIDSLDIQFFIPIHSINSQSPELIYSNPIRISYSEMMEVQAQKLKDEILFIQSLPPRIQK